MDAIEFVKQLRRMNEKGALKNRFIYPCVGRETDSPEDVVAEVEEWAKMNPVKTRQSVFLEQWPNCMMGDDDVVRMCPRNVDKMYACNLNRSGGCCTDCRREFWMQEVE